MARRFEPGDCVRVTVPDPTDPDHHYHGAVGTITAVRDQPLAPATGDTRDDPLYRVVFDDDQRDVMWFRDADLQRCSADTTENASQE